MLKDLVGGVYTITELGESSLDGEVNPDEVEEIESEDNGVTA